MLVFLLQRFCMENGKFLFILYVAAGRVRERWKEGKLWTIWEWFWKELLWEKLIMQFGGWTFIVDLCKTWSNITTTANKKIVKVTRFIFHNFKESFIFFKNKFNFFFHIFSYLFFNFLAVFVVIINTFHKNDCDIKLVH